MHSVVDKQAKQARNVALKGRCKPPNPTQTEYSGGSPENLEILDSLGALKLLFKHTFKDNSTKRSKLLKISFTTISRAPRRVFYA